MKRNKRKEWLKKIKEGEEREKNDEEKDGGVWRAGERERENKSREES